MRLSSHDEPRLAAKVWAFLLRFSPQPSVSVEAKGLGRCTTIGDRESDQGWAGRGSDPPSAGSQQFTGRLLTTLPL